jgi:hypothetical protein
MLLVFGADARTMICKSGTEGGGPGVSSSKRAIHVGGRAGVLIAGAVLLFVGLGLVFLVQRDERDDMWAQQAVVVENGAVADGWQTIEYQGVAVDLPESWQRVDNAGCQFDLEHWGPEEAPECSYDVGVMFMLSGSYDGRYGPGPRRSPPSEASPWSGYRLVEPWAVIVAHNDRDVAHRVLSSARPVQGG